MNPTPAAMPPITAAPSMGMPAPSPAAAPPGAMDMQALAQAMPVAPTQDSFMSQQAAPAAQQAPQPSPEEMAALMSLLGGGMPGQQMPGVPGMPGMPAPASGLQEVAGPNGSNMVLEQAPAAGPTGATAPSSGLFKWLGAAAAVGVGVLGFNYWRKNKSVTESAFEKLQKETDDVLDQVAQKLGLQDELEDLQANTIGRVKEAIEQNKAAINGIAEDAAELLEKRTDELFEYAKGLQEGASIQGQRVARAWKDAIENFKVKVLGQEGDEAAKAAD